MKKQSIEHARTKVVNKHHRALDQEEHRVLLQLHIVGDLQIKVHLRFPSVRANHTRHGNEHTYRIFRYTRHESSGMAGSRIKVNGEG
jgi:hypothetical protein